MLVVIINIHQHGRHASQGFILVVALHAIELAQKTSYLLGDVLKGVGFKRNKKLVNL